MLVHRNKQTSKTLGRQVRLCSKCWPALFSCEQQCHFQLKLMSWSECIMHTEDRAHSVSETSCSGVLEQITYILYNFRLWGALFIKNTLHGLSPKQNVELKQPVKNIIKLSTTKYSNLPLLIFCPHK